MMETSRTKLRREVREKRLAYFERNLSSQPPKLQEDAPYHGPNQAGSLSKNSSKNRTKVRKVGAGTDQLTQQRQPISRISTQEDTLSARQLGARNSRPSSARSGVLRQVVQYPQGPSGDDCANVTPLRRRKNRPSSALPSSSGDHYRLDISDSTRLTGNNLRPSSAKAGARPKRPQRNGRDPNIDQVVQRPSTAGMYRSNYENTRRQSEFEDFRKAAQSSSLYVQKETETTCKRGGRSDDELQEFVRSRELGQYSGKNVSPSSSERGFEAGGAQTYHFFKNQATAGPAGLDYKSDRYEQRLIRDDPYVLLSKTSLEEGISRRVQLQQGPQADMEALQASEFHSAYSAENMLQSLLTIRKVKAKVHDELLSSFLENEGYKSILSQKRKSYKSVDEYLLHKGSDRNGEEMKMDSSLLESTHAKSEKNQIKVGETVSERKQEEMPSALSLAPDNTSPSRTTQEEEQPDFNSLMQNDSVASNKDEGEESGVEMDDLSFDVGALCNAAKQGDDILRQYIRGLTEKVMAKKDKENREDNFLEESSSKSSAKIESLFAPKMPERKFDENTSVASAHVHVTDNVNAHTTNQSALPSYSESDSMKQKEIDATCDEDQTSLQGASTSKDLEGIGHGQNFLNLSLSSKFVSHENLYGSVQDSLQCQDSKEPVVSLEEMTDDPQNNVNHEDMDAVSDHKPQAIQEVFQDENSSVVSKVREPAVTADILEKLGLFDTQDSYASLRSSQVGGSGIQASADADSSTDDIGIQLANRTLEDSDLGLETFRPDSRNISPLKDVRDYSKAGVLTTSQVDSPDLIEELLDVQTPRKLTKVETAALRRTYDLSEDTATGDIADPSVNTPFHSHIQHSRYGVSFVFDPQDTGFDGSPAQTNSKKNTVVQPEQGAGNSNHGIAFEVDLTSARKQPKPPPTSKPSNSRLMTPSRGSPKHSQNSPQRYRPRKSPRTPDVHKDEVRQYHEKDRRMRKLSSPRTKGASVRNVASESSTSDTQSSLRLSLHSNMDTDRPSAEGIKHHEDIHEGLSELHVEVGAPFVHSPRHEATFEDENEVLDKIASFEPPGALGNVPLETIENQGTVNKPFGQHSVNFSQEGHQDRDPQEHRQDIHKASKPRPSSANPKRSATKKPGNNRPTSAHSKMYSSPDKSYDRKWPQSSMAWMTQHKLSSSLLGGDQSLSDLTASGSKVKISQSRVNREFARKGKPPVAVQMSRRDGEFVRVRSSKLFDGTVSRVLEGRGSGSVPPLTLQLIQDSPRGSESLSIWQLLPDEILLHIFSYLPQPMLVKCALTCQRFHRIAMDDSLWRTIRLENRDLTDFYLTHIGEKHPVSLTLHKCRGNLVTENGLRNLFRSCADSLQELNITGSSKGELQGDSILLHVSRCYNLISLDASWCAVTDNGLSAILDGCPRLENICLNGCQSVSDQCLRQIVNKYGPNLEVLELCGCFNLSPETLILLAETSNHLMTLNIAQCYKITDECVASVAPKFQSLQHWHLKGCKELRDSSVKKIARHCKQLRTLSIASCPHITDVSLIEIATYLNSIRSLDVSGCRKVGNEGMRCLATCCPYLEKVGLSSTSATHKSVSALASYASETLMELKLNCCREITEASIIKLLKHCKKLKTLHLYGVKGLRNLGILKVQYPCIEYLEKVRQI